MRIGVLGVVAVLLSAGAAAAQFTDWEEQYRTLLEMEQVRRGDYTYQIRPDGRIVPRCDRAANRLRRTRDPSAFKFPYPCGEDTDRGTRRRR